MWEVILGAGSEGLGEEEQMLGQGHLASTCTQRVVHPEDVDRQVDTRTGFRASMENPNREADR